MCRWLQLTQEINWNNIKEIVNENNKRTIYYEMSTFSLNIYITWKRNLILLQMKMYLHFEKLSFEKVVCSKKERNRQNRSKNLKLKNWRPECFLWRMENFLCRHIWENKIYLNIVFYFLDMKIYEEKFWWLRLEWYFSKMVLGIWGRSL